MATIKNTIKLQDKMTPVLRNIIKSLDTTVATMEHVDKSSKGAFGKVRKDVQQAQSALNNFNKHVDDVPKKAERGAVAFAKWKNPLVTASALIYTIKNALSGLGSTIKTVDSFTNTYARIGLMNSEINDGMYTTAELQDEILASALRSRSAYDATAQSVGKLGMLAGDAFSNTDEVIAFSEVMNKAFKVGGTGAQEAESAMYQLTQAMGAGKLQGDEFKSIMENAPMLATAIADFMGVPKGELKELSSEGVITADIIKGALFNSASEIDTEFQKLPKTFTDFGTTVKTMATEMFQPVFEKLSQIANSQAFATMQAKLIGFIQQMADYALVAIDVIGNIGTWVIANKDIVVGAIGAIITMLVAYRALALITAIQTGIAFAMANWPLLLLIGIAAALVFAWQNVGDAGKIVIAIIGGIVGAIGIWIAIQALLNKVLIANPIGIMVMAIGILIGVIIGLSIWLNDLWKNNLDFKYGIIGIWNSIMGFFDQVPVFFKSVGYGILDAFGYAHVGLNTILQNMVNDSIDKINNLITLVNRIPGVSIDAIEHVTFGTEIAIEEEGLRKARENAYNQAKDAADARTAQRLAETEANRMADEKTLAEERAKLEADKKKLEETPNDPFGADPGFDWDKLKMEVEGGNIDTVGRIDDQVEITEEDLKYLKDVAKTEFVNKYTTLRPELKVTFGDVHETADVNGLLSEMENMIESAYASSLVTG